MPIFLLLAIAACQPSRDIAHTTEVIREKGFTLEPVSFHSLRGWKEDNHGEALSVLLKSCAASLDKRQAFVHACQAAVRVDLASKEKTRIFFEEMFAVYAVVDGKGERHGFFTGYFEPEFNASLTRSTRFSVPLFATPEDLVAANGTFGRMEGGRLVPYHTRAEIEAGALTQKAKIIAWLADPVDAFFLHVQGSGRLVLDNGDIMRVGFASKNGRPYRAIGATLIEKGELSREDVSMKSIRHWLNAHPDRASEIMNSNESFIFFQELDVPAASGPIGAQGISLTPLRSLAVDKSLHALGGPVWLETEIPAQDSARKERFDRLMLAQDTGSAILGPIRGDIFFGSGPSAGERAGHMKAEGRLYILMPRVSS